MKYLQYLVALIIGSIGVTVTYYTSISLKSMSFTVIFIGGMITSEIVSGILKDKEK